MWNINRIRTSIRFDLLILSGDALLIYGGVVMERGKYKRKENNWKRGDNVFYNSLFGFDYCFCNSDCGNIHCGRNKKSDSYKAMLAWIRKWNGCYSCADFTASCRAWRKPKEGDTE